MEEDPSAIMNLILSEKKEISFDVLNRRNK